MEEWGCGLKDPCQDKKIGREVLWPSSCCLSSKKPNNRCDTFDFLRLRASVRFDARIALVLRCTQHITQNIRAWSCCKCMCMCVWYSFLPSLFVADRGGTSPTPALGSLSYDDFCLQLPLPVRFQRVHAGVAPHDVATQFPRGWQPS